MQWIGDGAFCDIISMCMQWMDGGAVHDLFDIYIYIYTNVDMQWIGAGAFCDIISMSPKNCFNHITMGDSADGCSFVQFSVFDMSSCILLILMRVYIYIPLGNAMRLHIRQAYVEA